MINKTYVVNLLRRADKRKHMEEEFSRLKEKGTNLNHVFFDAIDGANNDTLAKYNFKIPNWFDPNSGKAMTNGEVGCALSHYLIWKDIVDQVENKSLNENCQILILEDDVIFVDNFLEKLTQYTNATNLAYDMLYVHRKPLNLPAETKISLNINQIKKSYWTCGYILTYSGAKKLVNSNYLDNLIPVDEFLPIMYGCNVMGFEKLYESCEKITCYAVSPSLLKLTGNAFSDSETFHSQPFLDPNKFMLGNNKKFMILFTGQNMANQHSYQRLIYYCKLYGLLFKSLDYVEGLSQVQLLKNELKNWSASDIASTLIMVIAVNSTDFCNILPIASPSEIIEKFTTIATQSNNIVLPKSNNLGSNKTIFCAWADRIIKLVNSGKIDSVPLSILLTIESYINGSGVNDFVNDNNSEIFQQLVSGDNAIVFNHKSSRISNSKTKSTPCIIFSNDEYCTIMLNRIENYTGNNWNEYYGYRVSKTESNNSLPTIYLSFNVGHNINVINIINKLDYPKDLLTVRYNRIGQSHRCGEILNQFIYSDRNEIHKKDILNFISTKCDYYFFIDNNCVLENANVLKELIELNKSVVAPFIRKGNELWTNYWGDLDEKGFYKRSFDYLDIINGVKRGCWNVPYITSAFLIKRDIIESTPGLFMDNMEMDADMRMCANLRKKNIYMHVSNLNYYGKFEEDDEQPEFINLVNAGNPITLVNSVNLINPTNSVNPINLINPLASIKKEITIYDLFERRLEWEEKYLHPEFFKNKHNLGSLKCLEPCTDVFNFPLFNKVFCTELIEKMETYGKWSKGKDEHSDPRLGKDYYENVPTQDIQLFEIGLEKHWDAIVTSYISQMAKHLYSEYKTKGVHMAFVVRYHWQQQPELSPHHDASTYTVNIALNKGGVDYENGGCRFIRQNYVLKNQDPGMCCIHPGRLTHYHEGLKTTGGTRYILVSFIN